MISTILKCYHNITFSMAEKQAKLVSWIAESLTLSYGTFPKLLIVEKYLTFYSWEKTLYQLMVMAISSNGKTNKLNDFVVYFICLVCLPNSMCSVKN